jgi:hypothetical protein
MHDKPGISQTTRGVTIVSFLLGLLAPSPALADDPWIVYPGGGGPGAGKHIVLIAADDEYRSEQSIPALAQILAKRHGFTCTVLFAIDPKDGSINPTVKDNIPGLDALARADLLVFFARFRELPDDEMRKILEYVDSGKPILALRTSTHPFSYDTRKDSPYAKFDWRSQHPKGGFGRYVFGETWVNHYGAHQAESTRGLIAPGQEQNPILRGVTDIWGPSDVYEVRDLEGDCTPLILGQILTGMKPSDPPKPGMKQLPVAWTRNFTGPSGRTARIFTTTMGHVGDFESEGFRRLLVNACYWGLGMESLIPEKADVEFVSPFKPTPIGFGTHLKGIKPKDLKID